MAKRGRPKKTKVDALIKADFTNLPTTQELYREFIKISNIEKCREEGFVLREMLNGKNPSEIIKVLRRKHTDYYFDHTDFGKFLERNKEIREILEKENKITARRFKAAKAEVEEHMRDLFLFNKELVRDLYKEGDSRNLNVAVKNLSNIIMNYAKLAGYLDETEQRVNIVNLISDKYEETRLKDRIHRADFQEDVITVENVSEEDRGEKTDNKGS